VFVALVVGMMAMVSIVWAKNDGTITLTTPEKELGICADKCREAQCKLEETQCITGNESQYDNCMFACNEMYNYSISNNIGPVSDYATKEQLADAASQMSGMKLYLTSGGNFPSGNSSESFDYTLSITKEGDGSGTISSTNFNCNTDSTDCEQGYVTGTPVTLTATPDDNSIFLKWGGACKGGEFENIAYQDKTTVVAMDANRSCTAHFISKDGETLKEMMIVQAQIGILSAVAVPNYSCSVSKSKVYQAINLLEKLELPVEKWWNENNQWPTDITQLIELTDKDVRYVDSVWLEDSVVKVQMKSDVGKWIADGIIIHAFDSSSQTWACTSDMPKRFIRFCESSFQEETTSMLPLNISKTGDGSISTIPSGANDICETLHYPPDTEVTLTATPDADFVFKHFFCTDDGSLNSNTKTNPRIVTMDKVRNCNVIFVPAQTLNIIKTGNGSVTSNPVGIDCGADCKQDYATNTPVILTATPANGAIFTNWSGGNCSGTNPVTAVTMEEAKNCTANFELELKIVACDSVWLDDLIAKFENDLDSNPPHSIYQYDYQGKTVYYVPPQCCDQYSTLYDTCGNVICAPDGGITGTGDGTCPDFITARQNETVIFKQSVGCIAKLSVTPTVQEVSSDTGTTSFEVSTNECPIDWAATADDSWLTIDDGASGTNSGTITVNYNANSDDARTSTITVTADNADNSPQTVEVKQEGSTPTFDLTVSKTGNGTISANGINCGTDCSESYTANTQVTLTASPDDGSKFVNWTGACTGTNPNVTVTMDAAIACTANFVPITFDLTVSKTGNGTISANGINCGTDCSESYTANTQVTLTASPDDGYNSVNWTGACIGTETCQVTMNEAKEVTANFETVLACDSTTWRDDLIAEFKNDLNSNPLHSIYQYDYKGDTVYYVPPQCCDQYSTLYNACGKVICAPDGGITGTGDGTCSDFITARQNKTVIFKQSRVIEECIAKLSVTPTVQEVSSETGTTSFEVSTNECPINWAATASDSWLTIDSDASGTNSGTITVNYATNSDDARTSTIKVTAEGAENSPQTVEVKQAADEKCQAKLSVIPAYQKVPNITGSTSFEIVSTNDCQAEWAIEGSPTPIQPTSGTTPSQVTVQYTEIQCVTDPCGITDFSISSPNATNSPVIFTLQLGEIDNIEAKVYTTFGRISDKQGNPIADVTVQIGDKTTLTDDFGSWRVDLTEGSYTVTATKEGYHSESQSLTLAGDNLNIEVNIEMDRTGCEAHAAYVVEEKLVSIPLLDLLLAPDNSSTQPPTANRITVARVNLYLEGAEFIVDLNSFEVIEMASQFSECHAQYDSEGTLYMPNVDVVIVPGTVAGTYEATLRLLPPVPPFIFHLESYSPK